MLTRRSVLGGLAVTPFFTSAALAASPEVFAIDGVAIRGTDPVAYFKKSTPVMGSAAHSTIWKSVTWQFESEENLVAFEADPESYAPQFGGYCAWAVSRGYTADTVPEAWTIYEGKLYLNFSRRIQRRWARDIPGNIAKGDVNWPGVLA